MRILLLLNVKIKAMRTRILSLICGVLLAVTATAQPHLSFKGIPITGSMTSFCQQLKAKGFT